MKDTREKILHTALTLFNRQGLPRVTLRAIAKEMGISQGNLNYHYKKRDEIIEALYFQLVARIDMEMEKSAGEESPLEQLFEIMNRIMDSFYEYRFFLLDFVHIMRENGTIRQHYGKLSQKREKQFKLIFAGLVHGGLMRDASFAGEHQLLYKRFQILADFWMASAEAVEKTIDRDTVAAYAQLIAGELYPYLTNKGKEEFHRLFSLSR